MARHVYICWCRYQRRPESLQRFLPLEVFFIAAGSQRRAIKWPSYVLSAISMLRILVRTRPDTLWLQLAPSLLLYPAFLYKLFVRPDLLIIADCHNSALRPRWLNLPFAQRLLCRCDLVFFHNGEVLERARKLGIVGSQVQVLHTPPATPRSRVAQRPKIADRFGPEFILMPSSFSSDEPMEVVAGAAARLPHLTFVLTGDVSVARRKYDLKNWPPNIVLTGFLPIAELDWLLTHARAVVALTTKPDIELSAGNEALGFGKPLIATDSLVSRSLFGEYATLVDPHSIDSLASGIEKVLQTSAMAQHVEAQRSKRIATSVRETAAVLAHLSCGPAPDYTVLR